MNQSADNPSTSGGRREGGKYRVPAISRNDLMALTEEAAKVSGIPYVMDAYREEAERIISG